MITPCPDVSLLLAVRNEAKHISATLSSIVQQRFPLEKIEVLVLDAESTDGTAAIALAFQDRLPQLRVIPNPKRLAAAAWNLGLTRASAPFVVILSGHVVLPRAFISEALSQLRPSWTGVGGVAVPVGTDKRSELIAAAFSCALGNGGASFMSAATPREVETMAFGFYRREDLLQIGGFDETIVRGQDWDLNLRLRQAGKKLWLFPAWKIEYATRSNFWALWKRQFWAGYWKPYIHIKNSASFLLRHCLPGAFVAGLIVLLAFGFLWKPLWLLLAASLGVHGVASLYASWKNRLSFSERLEFWWAIWIIHIAYGLGFWAGIPRALIRFFKG